MGNFFSFWKGSPRPPAHAPGVQEERQTAQQVQKLSLQADEAMAKQNAAADQKRRDDEKAAADKKRRDDERAERARAEAEQQKRRDDQAKRKADQKAKEIREAEQKEIRAKQQAEEKAKEIQAVAIAKQVAEVKRQEEEEKQNRLEVDKREALAKAQREAKARRQQEEEKLKQALEEDKRRLEQEAEEQRQLIAKQKAELEAEQKRLEEESRLFEQQRLDEEKRRLEEQRLKEAEEEKQRVQHEQEIQRHKEEVLRLEREIEERCQRGVEEQCQIEQDWPKPEWLTDTTRANIGVTGRSGVGKSSLINRMLHLGKGNARAAKTSISECTMEATPYDAPNSAPVTIWDLPGAGTDLFPEKEYLHRMGLRYFDGLLVVGTGRVSEIDHRIFKEALKWEIPCYLIRNKADDDIRNNLEDGFQPAHTVQHLLVELRNKMRESLVGEEHLARAFVISTKVGLDRYPDVLNPEYERFMGMLERDVERQRQVPVPVQCPETLIGKAVAKATKVKKWIKKKTSAQDPQVPLCDASAGLPEDEDFAIAFTVVGAGWPSCNGNYREVDTLNGKPRYQKIGGSATVYFSGHWKMNDKVRTNEWVYSVQSAMDSTPPTGAWTLHRCKMPTLNATPAPTLSTKMDLHVGSKVVVGVAFSSNNRRREHLRRDLQGVVQRIDADGDAQIKFLGMNTCQWVFQSNFPKLVCQADGPPRRPAVPHAAAGPRLQFRADASLFDPANIMFGGIGAQVDFMSSAASAPPVAEVLSVPPKPLFVTFSGIGGSAFLEGLNGSYELTDETLNDAPVGQLRGRDIFVMKSDDWHWVVCDKECKSNGGLLRFVQSESWWGNEYPARVAWWSVWLNNTWQVAPSVKVEGSSVAPPADEDSPAEFKKIQIFPFLDTLQDYDCNIFGDYLKPYLTENIHKTFSFNDIFTYNGVRFKVIACDPDTTCRINFKNTDIFSNGVVDALGDPLSPEEVQRLAEAEAERRAAEAYAAELAREDEAAFVHCDVESEDDAPVENGLVSGAPAAEVPARAAPEPSAQVPVWLDEFVKQHDLPRTTRDSIVKNELESLADVLELSEDDLKDVIPAVGPRKKLQKALQLHRQGYQQAQAPSDAPACQPPSGQLISPSRPTGVQRLHGLGQQNSDLQGTYKSIKDFLKDFEPDKRVSEYITEAAAQLMPGRFVRYLPNVLEEVGKITQSLLDTPDVRAKLDECGVQPMEVFAIVFYSYDLALVDPDDWSSDKTDNWYYVQNVILQERNYEKLRVMQGYLFFFNKGLRKLPDWQGVLYRGIDEIGAELIKSNYTEGRRVHFSATSSATSCPDVSVSFAGDRGVVLIMRVRTGREIRFISAIENEQEVLLFPNTAFLVTKAFYFNEDLGCHAVEMMEADPCATHVF